MGSPVINTRAKWRRRTGEVPAGNPCRPARRNAAASSCRYRSHFTCGSGAICVGAGRRESTMDGAWIAAGLLPRQVSGHRGARQLRLRRCCSVCDVGWGGRGMGLVGIGSRIASGAAAMPPVSERRGRGFLRKPRIFMDPAVNLRGTSGVLPTREGPGCRTAHRPAGRAATSPRPHLYRRA
jgi:hypothetical protein